jgi:energy-coupling factor transporter ATP-binding protein EcfA2
MKYPTYFEPKKSLKLFGLSDEFNLLKKLYIKKKFPKVLMLTGRKGSGKSTLIHHLMYYIFDNANYEEDNFELKNQSHFYSQFSNNIFSNIIYINGSDYKNTKIEDIRILKKKIYQTSILDKPRFAIFDDVELFNNSSLNALLKIIEEPSKNNHFILINNKSKPLLDTIKSRCLNINIILNELKRKSILETLIKKFNVDLVIDPIKSQLTPGNFIKFNYFFEENKISINDDYLKNLGNLLNLYKKDKQTIFIDLILFLTNSYFDNLNNKQLFTNEKIVEYKRFVFENINKFFLYNLNQNALLNSINIKINEK